MKISRNFGFCISFMFIELTGKTKREYNEENLLEDEKFSGEIKREGGEGRLTEVSSFLALAEERLSDFKWILSFEDLKGEEYLARLYMVN